MSLNVINACVRLITLKEIAIFEKGYDTTVSAIDEYIHNLYVIHGKYVGHRTMCTCNMYCVCMVGSTSVILIEYKY